MTPDRRPLRFALSAILALTGTLMLAGAALAQDEPISVREWSELVWNSAKAGDATLLQDNLMRQPVGFVGQRLARVRENLEAYQTNHEAAKTKRAESREKALEELRSHLKDGNLSPALRAAVAFQTLGDSMDDALEVDEVREVIRQAQRAIPEAQEQADWLYAQELLFRLRTLYDDTSEFALYGEYDNALKDLNQRIALLQLYAPSFLHDLRSRLAVRFGEDPLPEFDPKNAPDWRERVDNVNREILERALRRTASEHIESKGSEGWRPLLDGGLAAMELIASTKALAETFAEIADEDATAEWIEFVHEWQGRMNDIDDASLRRRHLQQVLAGLENLNARTIRIPEAVLLREFGDGAMFELSVAKHDDYSAIIWPDQMRRFRQQTEGNFVGVGIYITQNERRDIVVINPLEGTPAFRAGIRPDDIIVSVDGISTVGWSLTDAVARITGKKGDVVKLLIKRATEEEEIEIPIVRDKIDLPSVKGWYKSALDESGKPVWDWMIDRDNGIAYVRVTGFTENTHRDLMRAWRTIVEQNVSGLIIDLRFNPGGLLDQAFEVANLFIDDGEVVSIEGKPGTQREPLTARRNRAAIKNSGVNVVVLVNKGSASASEIVSGALQAHGAAVLVGTRTWGKGSVQRVYRVPPNAQLKLTTQYYRLPPREGELVGRLVHKRPNTEVWGVDPDIVVDMTPEQIQASMDLRQAADRIRNPDDDDDDKERPDVYDLIAKGLDPQLETALLILQAKSIADAGGDHARLN